MSEQLAGCKRPEVAEVMVVRHSEVVPVALRGPHEMGELGTCAVVLNVFEARQRPGVEKKEIVGEELKLMEESHTADN